jgi:hypothetical protein
MGRRILLQRCCLTGVSSSEAASTMAFPVAKTVFKNKLGCDLRPGRRYLNIRIAAERRRLE